MVTYVYPDVQLERGNLTEYKDFPGRVFIPSEKGSRWQPSRRAGLGSQLTKG